MSKWDLASLDRNTAQMIGRPLQEAMAHGINNNIIHGGLVTGQTAIQSVYAQSATKNCTLGTKLREVDTGREFCYSRAGGVALARGYMTESAVAVANYDNEVQTAYGWAVGATSGYVLITTGATPAADYFADGWLCVQDGTGEAQAYPILSNTSHATILYITLKPGHSVVTAWPAESELTLLKNPFDSTIVAPVTTLTACPAGVPIVPVTECYYYWSQVKGPCPMFVDTGDTITIGEPVGAAGTNAVAGAVGVATTIEGRYGRAMSIAAQGECAMINLDLGL